MTTKEALMLIEQVTAALNLNRAGHLKILEALQVLGNLVSQESVIINHIQNKKEDSK